MLHSSTLHGKAGFYCIRITCLVNELMSKEMEQSFLFMSPLHKEGYLYNGLYLSKRFDGYLEQLP